MRNKIIFVAIIVTALGFVFLLNKQKDSNKSAQTASNETSSPQIVSTKPETLEDAVISADQTIEITFNKSLENVGEFKVKIEPEIEHKLELSQDRKTGKIIPQKPFELGTTYTIFIGPETKFDGVGKWGQEKVFHVHTIKYRGI
jgi:hypothetical protein